MYEEDTPFITLSKPVLITKNSNCAIIAKFLKDRLRLAAETHYLEDHILDNDNGRDGPGVIVRYSKINLF